MSDHHESTGRSLRAHELLAIHDRLAAAHAQRVPAPTLADVEALLARVRERSIGQPQDAFADAANHARAIACEPAFGKSRLGVAFVAAAVLLRRAGQGLRAPESEAAVMTRALASEAASVSEYARWLRRSGSALPQQAPTGA